MDRWEQDKAPEGEGEAAMFWLVVALVGIAFVCGLLLGGLLF